MNDSSASEFDVIADPQARLHRWQMPDFGGNNAPRTAQEIEDIERAAYDEGRARGEQDGYRAGQELAQQQAQRLRVLIEHLARPLQQLDEEVEQMLGDLACRIARRILDAELQLQPERVLNLVRSALAELPEELRELKVDVHPQDAQLLREQLQPPLDLKRFRIAEDAQLQPGDCRLQTESLYVDARLDVRVGNLREGLQGESR